MKHWLGLLLVFGTIHGYGAEEEQEQEIVAFERIEVAAPLSSEGFRLPEAPPIAPPYKSPWLAAVLSTLFPGLGHTYLGDMKMSVGLAGATGLSYGLSFAQGVKEPSITGLTIAQSTWFYSIYAAYRDARAYNKGTTYSYPMPTDTLKDLIAAPFQWSVIKKPEVWGAFLGACAAAVAVIHFAYADDACIAPRLSLDEAVRPLVAFPVGIGEESLFRGYLQSQLADITTPWTGIALSSLAFGAAHIPNALLIAPEHRWRYYSFSLPMITAMGTYFGWLTYKNRSLKESVALHAWYDFAIFSLSFLAAQAAAIDVPTSFAWTIPF